MVDKDFFTFVKEFDIADNALSMRSLRRWNGRDLPHEENLSEHTHLVVACAIKLYDDFKLQNINEQCFEPIVRLAMIHDSLEMYRGDILATTKDSVPGLRDYIDKEEERFQFEQLGRCSELVRDVVKLSDLMARYLFIKGELKRSTNEFTYEAFESSKNLYYTKYVNFITEYNLDDKYEILDTLPSTDKVFRNIFAKGYESDAGIDVKLTKPFIILPHTTVSIEMDCYCTPKEGEMAIMCARTSAAAKGLSVALCPIDPNYTGKLTAIVHNISNKIIEYKEGESFCQIVFVKLADETIDYAVKKDGKRSNGKLGSTGR